MFRVLISEGDVLVHADRYNYRLNPEVELTAREKDQMEIELKEKISEEIKK